MKDTVTQIIEFLTHGIWRIRLTDMPKSKTQKIKILREFCKSAKINIKNTVTSENINDYKELIELAQNLKLNGINFNPIISNIIISISPNIT